MPLEELLIAGRALPITRWGDPVLHRPARPVTEFGPELWNLLADMFATSEAASGAGLAAAQVGVDLAVFIFDCADGFGRRRQGLRPDFAVCEGQDQFGEPLTVRGTGMLARCLQHETDHLNGIVLEDHLTEAQRRELRRQHNKAAARYPADWPASEPVAD